MEEIYSQHVTSVGKGVMEEWHVFGSVIENIPPIQNRHKMFIKYQNFCTVILLETERSLLFYLYIIIVLFVVHFVQCTITSSSHAN